MVRRALGLFYLLSNTSVNQTIYACMQCRFVCLLAFSTISASDVTLLLIGLVSQRIYGFAVSWSLRLHVIISAVHYLLIFCWPSISLQILANNQLDAYLHLSIYFISLHVSSITVLIIRRSNCVNISSDMISLCKWQVCRSGGNSWPAYQAVTQTNHTRWLIQFDLLMMSTVMLETCRKMK
jgi:hypothetical protein